VNCLSLFSGIGGLDLGLERAGMTIVGQVEIDPFARSILARHWPDTPRHDDVRTALAWWRGTPRPRVDVVAGGYPCQPESIAGRRVGTGDERWLWPAMARVIAGLRPRYMIGENVVGHRTGGLRFVIRDLERLGYVTRTGIVHACEVGAPHSRPRLFILANANRVNGAIRLGPGPGWALRSGNGTTSAWADPAGGLETLARTGRMDDGVSRRLDGARVRALGNACVPQVGEFVGRLLLSYTIENDSRRDRSQHGSEGHASPGA
jgi:DNA (cytosine-5)-methyltransferase 1